MKTSFLTVGAALLALSVGAQAQIGGQRNNGGNGNGNNRNSGGGNGGNNGGGALPLPEGVTDLVSIDAFNILLAQIDRDGRRDLSPIIVRHIYSGGVARLFGGSSVPTELFVTPGEFGGGNNGGGGNGGFGGGNTGIGGIGGGGFGGGGGGIGGIGGGLGGGGIGGGGIGGGGIGGIGGGFGGGQMGGGGFGAFQMRPSALSTRASAFRSPSRSRFPARREN